MQRISDLEALLKAQVSQRQVVPPPPPVHTPTPEKPSRVEQLLEQMVQRVGDLEKQVVSAPPSKGKVSGGDSALAEEDDDGSSEETEEACITTPGGKTAPLMN